MDFLNKTDPVADIKERLYARVSALKSITEMNDRILPWNEFEGGAIAGENAMITSEIEFFNELLDIIERS